MTASTSLLHAFNSHTPFDISADMIEYVDEDQSLTADGHVVVIQGTSTLKADHMRYERQAQRFFARGHVIAIDKGGTLIGESLEYNLQAESGTMTNAMGHESPWIFSATAWQKELDYYTGRNVSFTSCDLVDPHYHIRSSRVHLVPDSYFWAWNNIAYADTMPVFYSPFVYRNLGKRWVVIQFDPGHDTVSGNFVKTITTIRLTDHVYDKFLYDYYTGISNGIGNEFNYDLPQMRGSLFGYYINPHQDPAFAGASSTEQYNLRAYHWQRMNSNTTLQSNINYRKNVSFNNRYFPQDINQSVNDITSSLALTQQTGHLNHRMVVEQLDAPDAGDTSPDAETHVQSASYPRYDATLYQIPLWNPSKSVVASTSTAQPAQRGGERLGPLLLNANGSFANAYQRTDRKNHLNGSGSFTLSEAMPLSRQFSFTPTLSPSFTWQDRFAATTPPPAGSTEPVTGTGQFRGFQGRVGTAETLRWRPFSSFTLDQTYSLTARMAPNETSLDRDPADNGIETHHLSWLAFWRPNRRVLMRSFSGYDLRQIDDETLTQYHQRKWESWTSELTLQPTRTTELFTRYAAGFYPTRGQLWEADYRFHGPYKTLLDTGLLYNEGSRGAVTWNNGIGLYLSPGWRVDARMHALIPNTSIKAAIQGANMIDDEFIVTRDLHCWQAQFVYRNIPPFTRQYSLLFNLKLGVKAAQEITHEELESEFYPWRARTYAP